MPKGTKKRKKLGWNVAHTANSDIELKAEGLLQQFLSTHSKEFVESVTDGLTGKERRKLVKALSTCELMLVWREDEAGLPTTDAR